MAKAKISAETVHDRERIIVRLPDGMRDKIAEMAEANGRSMTAEVVAALEQHLKGPDRLSAIEDFIEEHRDNIAAVTDLWEKVEKIEGMVYDHDERFNPMKYDRD